MDEPVCALLPCGHQCVCRECAPITVGYHDIDFSQFAHVFDKRAGGSKKKQDESDFCLAILRKEESGSEQKPDLNEKTNLPLHDWSALRRARAPICSTFPKGKPDGAFSHDERALGLIVNGVLKPKERVEAGWKFVLLQGQNTLQDPFVPIPRLTQVGLGCKLPKVASGVRIFPTKPSHHGGTDSGREEELLLSGKADEPKLCPICRKQIGGSAREIYL
jgi:hypothetical protein